MTSTATCNHISVLRSPLPFPFGVNITGDFADCRIRLGGPRFNPDLAIERMRLLGNRRINMVKELRWFASIFMQKAAEADRSGTHVPLVDSAGHRLDHIHNLLLTALYKEQ